MKKLAVGDFCFHEFRLSMIKEMREYGVTVGNGISETSGSTLDRCQPLEYKILKISQTFEYYYDQLHGDAGVGLNWPDIHLWFVNKWMEACDNKDNDKERNRCMHEMAEFCREIIDGCKSLQTKTISGVTAFARR